MAPNIEISNLDFMRPVFSLGDLSYSYPESPEKALEGISLSVNFGETFALLGPNGAGKTTLLRILCGRLSADEKSLQIADEVRKGNALDLSRCGILLENPGVYPKLSIEEYLRFFAEFYTTKNVTENIRELSKRLELPRLSTRMGELSLGTRQKVQIARALVHGPSVLLLDEPVANLDPGARDAVWSLLRDWKRETGGTLLLSSHILSEMERVATTFGILYRGRLLQTGPVEASDGRTFTLEVRVPEGSTPEALLNGIPPSARVLSASPKRLSLEAVYRDALQKFGEDSK